MPATRVQLEGIAALLYDLAVELTRDRRGGGPHWIMIADLYDALARYGLDLGYDDLQAAIAIAVERCVLKTRLALSTAIALLVLLGSLSAAVAPAAAQAWLTVGGADGKFSFEMPVPFDLPPSETEPDGSVTFSYVHETTELALRFEVVDAAPCSCELMRVPGVVASRIVVGTRVEQTRVRVVELRTYRLVAISTPELENDPMIIRFLGSMRVAR